MLPRNPTFTAKGGGRNHPHFGEKAIHVFEIGKHVVKGRVPLSELQQHLFSKYVSYCCF